MADAYFIGAHASAILMLVAVSIAPVDVLKKVNWQNCVFAIVVWPIVIPQALVLAWRERRG